MYHAIIRHRIVALFAAVNEGNAQPVIEAFASRFEHVFLGEHALGGTRTSLEKTKLWYERLYRLLPDINFTLRRISICGMPWNTIVVVDWDETNSGTDGVRANASGYHLVHIKWGRVTRLVICPDTVPLVGTLARLGKLGHPDAQATKIVG